MRPKAPAVYVIGPHAASEMVRRGLDEEIVRRVLVDPEQEIEVRAGGVIFQSPLSVGRPERTYLVRVVVDK